VIAPAKTGNDSKRRIAVNKTDQTKRGIISISIPSPRIFEIVVIKLADPKILLTPAR
jgi:hypothetical protein